jgi:hypothetical protein
MARNTILIDAFREVLRVPGDYRYVAQVPVLRPVRAGCFIRWFIPRAVPPVSRCFATSKSKR